MIDAKRRCAAVIPCCNESRAIAAVVRGARGHLPAVFVVDDGSRDGTDQVAAQAGAVVLRQTARAGKGAALRRGWQEAHRRGFEWAMTLDGDGQHDPADIPSFLSHADAADARLIIGNRMGAPGGMPWTRRLANTWMSRCLSNVARTPLPDSQCGFRLVHLPSLLSLRLNSTGFVIESEMLVQWLAAGWGVDFIPVRAIYGREQSKIRPMIDTWRWLRWRAAQSPSVSFL